MRRWLAHQLHTLATRIYNTDHKELVEVRDEYDICRCRIEVVGDDLTHGVEATFDQLPEGWHIGEQIDVGRPDPHKH